MQSVLRQVHSLSHSRLSTECDLLLSNFQYPLFSLRPSSSCLLLLPRQPVTSIFPSITCFIRQFTYSTQTKLRIFNTNVKAVLLYGCETWKNSKYVTTKLQVFINKSLRKILRIFWPDQITNNELWKRTKQPKMDLQIRKRKWGWLGHTLPKPMEDITRQALEWNPQGKRGRGRPKNMWRRTVLEEAKGMKKTWAEIKCDAKNRVRWRILVDALCSAAE